MGWGGGWGGAARVSRATRAEQPAGACCLAASEPRRAPCPAACTAVLPWLAPGGCESTSGGAVDASARLPACEYARPAGAARLTPSLCVRQSHRRASAFVGAAEEQLRGPPERGPPG